MKKEEIRELLKGKHHLEPIFSSVYYIPERLSEYDHDFFIVWNKKRHKYEVHSLENPLSTYCLTVPYNELDVRTIRHVWKNDIRMHGKEIFRDLAKEEDRIEKEKQREFKNWVEDVAKETQPLMAKTAWT